MYSWLMMLCELCEFKMYKNAIVQLCKIIELVVYLCVCGVVFSALAMRAESECTFSTDVMQSTARRVHQLSTPRVFAFRVELENIVAFISATCAN
jgi:hypothetical protein